MKLGVVGKGGVGKTTLSSLIAREYAEQGRKVLAIDTDSNPNLAISLGAEIYEIDPAKCTECVGHFDEPQCVQVCPVACIPVNPQHVESRETLWQKFQRLQHQGAGPSAQAPVPPSV